MGRKCHSVNGVVPVESILLDLGNEPFSVNIQKRDIKLRDQPVLRGTKNVCSMLKKAMRVECVRGRATGEATGDLTGWGLGRPRSCRALRDTKDLGLLQVK